MTKPISKPAALAFAAAFTFPCALPIAAETTQPGDSAQVVEEVFVVGKRRAYQGNFDNLEKPSADQIINEDLLREVGAINLNEALDLSAAVARQNNFGGLWNSFSVRGFSGDINLPSGFLVNGFNAGRGFAGPRDLAGVRQRDQRFRVLAQREDVEVGHSGAGPCACLCTIALRVRSMRARHVNG